MMLRCVDCGWTFTRPANAPIDALCPSCREAFRARMLARTACPRCKEPWKPRENASACDQCMRAELMEHVARYGSG